MLLKISSLHVTLESFASAGLMVDVMKAAAVAVVFTVVAWFLKGVTFSGALAGAVLSFAMYLSGGPAAFAALLAVFVIAVGTTRVGYPRKQVLGMAESREGRSASQILANIGVATLSTVLFAVSRKSLFLVATAAALAEAAADTASSEIGEAWSEQARLITTYQLVPAGTNGGVTLPGTVAGAIAAFTIAGCSFLVHLIPPIAFWVVGFSGFLGMLLDSVLGAVLERRQVLNNDTVNLLGTSLAAVIALVLARMLA